MKDESFELMKAAIHSVGSPDDIGLRAIVEARCEKMRLDAPTVLNLIETLAEIISYVQRSAEIKKEVPEDLDVCAEGTVELKDTPALKGSQRSRLVRPRRDDSEIKELKARLSALESKFQTMSKTTHDFKKWEWFK